MTQLLSAVVAGRTGTGLRLMDNYTTHLYVHVEGSGNSASAALLASPSTTPLRYLTVTAWAVGATQSATAQLTGFYPNLVASVTWVSAAAGGTGSVNLWVEAQRFMHGLP